MIQRTTHLTTRHGVGPRPRILHETTLAVAAFLSSAVIAVAQGPPPSVIPTTADVAHPSNDLESVAAQVREIRMALDAMREQLAGSRGESEELRRQLQTVREHLDSLQCQSGPAPASPAGAPDAGDRIDALAEEQDILGAKVDGQEQTKVESGSKYHVRLSGLALLNVVSTFGSVDSLDLPVIAQPRGPGDSGGSFAAGVRQSLLGLEVFGPLLGGARTTGGLSFDFFGGFPLTSEGVSAPLVRLRTMTSRLDWKNTSVRAGQEAPFFSPRSPTSLTSTAYPALSSAGNVWTWTPQLEVEHRIALSTDSTMTVQGGILDSFTGELPAGEYSRMTTAGERSRLPAQAIRVGWQRRAAERVVALGAGAYHASQDWGFDRTVEAWAATIDWDVPLGRSLALSGELYRGRAIGGLGGGASDSVLFDGPSTEAASSVRPVDSTGGWSQLKYKPASRLEFNAAFGEDDPVRAGSRQLLAIGSPGRSPLKRNASALLNSIYQARSNLLFSVEYRRLWTTSLGDETHIADHVSVAAGVVF